MAIIEFFKKSGKFLLGVVITILGGMLLFRKDESGAIIKESTDAGDKSLKEVIESNEIRKEAEDEAEKKAETEIRRIKSLVEKKEKDIPKVVRDRIMKRLGKKNVARATQILSEELGIKNLDDIT